MGNAQCCTSADTGEDAAGEAMPKVETWPPCEVGPPGVSGGNTPAERMYKASLVKVEGQTLGMESWAKAKDVDFMAERSVLPILFVSGGIADAWNKEHPEAKISDSIVEVNGVRSVEGMLQKCKVDPVLSLTLIKCLTYGHLVQDLEKLISTKGCGPIMIRLAWHDAGVFNGVDGCPNAAMRLAGGGEYSFGANAGLPQVAIPLLKQITEKYVPRLISHADLWALAANVAIKVMGGPSIVTHFGRLDAQGLSEGAPSAQGRLPDADKDAQHLRDIFYPKGFTDKDIVALSGAHSVGAPSDFRGMLIKDNSYFRDLLKKTWTKATAKNGKTQYVSGKTMMLPTDMVLIEDAKFKPYAEKYAADQNAFFEDYKEAWVKLQELGCGRLRDIL